MKNKILRILLAIVVALPMFTSVLAVSYEDLLARLDVIIEDIDTMKQEYNQILETYPDVIDSLSEETKQAAQNLANNLMAEDIVTTVQNLKAELSASDVTDADKVLEAIESLQDSATELIESNKDIVEDVKTGYSDLTVEEIQQVVEKTTEILESLGAEVDVTATYEAMMTILDEAHEIALEITEKIEAIIASNAETFEQALSKSLAKELFNELKNKDEEAVIETLIEALNNTDNGAETKAELKAVKELAIDLKNKIMEMETLKEQDLLMFTDEQKQDVKNKVKEVELDFIDFAKVIIDNYSEDYMDVVISKVYNQSVDNMIRYANTALDYWNQYEGTIRSLSLSTIVAKLPQDLVQKAGVMVALGFVDISEYNMSYIKTSFRDQIDNLKDYLSQEIVEYISHISNTIEQEVDDAYSSSEDATLAQSQLRALTTARFKTIANIEALKTRVAEELLANRENLRAELDQMVSFVNGLYEENILISIASTLIKENEEDVRSYVVSENDECILTNRFITTSEFTAELGIPTEKSNIVEYSQTVNSTIKTGSSFMVELNGSTIEAPFAVLGDIYADGMVDARDYMMIKNYIMDGEEISDLSLVAADTYEDNMIDARDYMAIKNYIMDGTEIPLVYVSSSDVVQ